MRVRNVHKYLFYFYVILALANETSSLNCYVCGQEDISDCSKFNYSNQNLYAKECPLKYNTCFAQTKGSIIISMSCEEDNLNDCKSLGDTKYCYCKTHLCNGKPATISNVDVTNDDEDLSEGSGYGDVSPEPPIETTVQPPNTGDCLRSAFIVIAAAALLW